ncbi:endolytic transglycosylase MltG [Candidatus Kaiserbacteria bacterium]|nr:endolytic transglycosylase MltG [Candidatus Kaiserbacteria bacterium]
MNNEVAEEIYKGEQVSTTIHRRRFLALVKDFLLHTFWESPVKKAISFSIALLLIASYISLISPPSGFPVGHIITVEKGTTLKDIADNLNSSDVVRSPLLFYSAVIILGGEKSAHAGDYYLYEKEGVFTLAYRIVHGKFGLTPIVVQIPEGLNIKELAQHLTNSIDTFDMSEFLRLAEHEEGYLFPDTYHFLPNVSEEEVYHTMRDTFDIRIEEISTEVKDFTQKMNRSLEEVITMASIIELEASEFETKRNVSGVLWNRMEIGMALQVDASFAHLLNKGTSQLSLEDLEIDSPYNTYKHKGLPPGPISNPGLDSILAAVTPIEHNYFYYLADKSGVTHFSKTFNEHTQKKATYID